MNCIVEDNYPVVVFWWEPDREWVADVPDLRGCSASGATPEEAIREALVARRLWLEVAREDGVVLPDPGASPYLPEIAREHFAAEVVGSRGHR